MNAIFILCAVLEVLLQKVYLSEAQVNNVNRKHATQMKFPPDDIEPWLNPSDGVLATEKTPVYIVREDPNNVDNFVSTKLNRAMKEALAYLRQHKSFALSHQAQFVNVNQNPDDINRGSTKLPPIQMASSYPTIIYPRIIVIVDNELFKNVGYDIREIILYTLAYWNGVDLLFRNIESPKIRINIPAILIVECPTFYPKFHFAPDKIHGGDLMSQARRLLNDNHFPIDSYDMIALLISNELYTDTEWVAGLAGLGKPLSCVVRDWGHFMSIRVMAHEVGHLLGIDHDGTQNTKCPESDYAIMAVSGYIGPKFFEWSNCSLDQLTEELENKNLYNKIDVQGAAVPRILPGKLTDLDEQCIRRSGNNTKAMNEEGNCKTLTCQAKPGNVDPNYKRTWELGPIDGSYCGQGKICLLRKCVKIS
ncbi:A disintegrin and metalloproteinase with thrombospondin motifs like [Microplitis mediator]|uniref:A disintegrin and metalloproteinase with thrombospondin motifs like n=1 Tax=Microplitis mediator TaxID=375433 RepID=UPI0025544222|nr:A disintegrin and metalloproteinase with thrombospondin motifs like [Microplitis mediator]